jgi:hypothetical protein
MDKRANKAEQSMRRVRDAGGRAHGKQRESSVRRWGLVDAFREEKPNGVAKRRSAVEDPYSEALIPVPAKCIM